MKRQRQGLTLMELIVALGLSVSLMALIGSSMQFYAYTLKNRDEEVRRATIARAVMSMVTADLRAALWIEQQDLSVATKMFSSANALGAMAGLSGGGATGAASSAGGSSGGGTASGGEAASTDGAEDESAPLNYSITSRPGLIGSTTQIQFDVSRLPRVDQMNTIDPYALPSEMTDVPSDIKTVSYLIQAAGMTGVRTSLGISPSDMAEGGLVRRVLDREATKYANESGDLMRLSQTGTLIAPEVTGIEFEYWDGTLWQYSWHSDDMGGLPQAVKVRIIMEGENSSPETVTNPDIYETIVRLPMASASLSSGTGTTATSETTDGSSAASTNGGA